MAQTTTFAPGSSAPGRGRPEIARAIATRSPPEQRARADRLGELVSRAVLEATGSVMRKVRPRLPGRRYYGGCEFVDVAESLAIERAKQLFGADHANVQPHSGAQANMAVYMAL